MTRNTYDKIDMLLFNKVKDRPIPQHVVIGPKYHRTVTGAVNALVAMLDNLRYEHDSTNPDVEIRMAADNASSSLLTWAVVINDIVENMPYLIGVIKSVDLLRTMRTFVMCEKTRKKIDAEIFCRTM